MYQTDQLETIPVLPLQTCLLGVSKNNAGKGSHVVFQIQESFLLPGTKSSTLRYKVSSEKSNLIFLAPLSSYLSCLSCVSLRFC